MSKIPPRPILKPSVFLKETSPSSFAIDYKFVSGPKKEQIRVQVTQSEYTEILDRVLNSEAVIKGIISTWRQYSSDLQRNGDNAEPPLGSYHKELTELCDLKDPGRAAILGTVFCEQIEADAFYKYIIKFSPSWSHEIIIDVE